MVDEWFGCRLLLNFRSLNLSLHQPAAAEIRRRSGGGTAGCSSPRPAPPFPPRRATVRRRHQIVDPVPPPGGRAPEQVDSGPRPPLLRAHRGAPPSSDLTATLLLLPPIFLVE
uniref:Uncharacterized protein n=2 Tax=Oryza sativa subsp. japonica TaxID=39947 RepID=Q69LW5_ORYSJ|nr:unknown protein [Oryza sativa Japonica Group]